MGCSHGCMREQEGAELTTLGGSGVEHYSGGCVNINLDFLGFVHEKVQNPVAQCGTQVQSVRSFSEFDGDVDVVG